MGFFSKLKKVVPIVDKGAVIASGVLPGQAGQVAGDVAQGAGVVTTVVQQLQAQAGSSVSPAEAQQQATLATAVAVDDHEERIKALEAELAALRAAQGGQPAQADTTGQPAASGQTGQTGESIIPDGASQSPQAAQAEPSGPQGQS